MNNANDALVTDTNTNNVTEENTAMTTSTTTTTATETPAIVPVPRVRGAAPAATTNSAPRAVSLAQVEASIPSAALKHSAHEETIRDFIKNKVGEGSILNVTRLIPGETEGSLVENTSLYQVTEIRRERGRYGYTALIVTEFKTGTVSEFNWRAKSGIKSIEIAKLNDLAALMQKADADTIKAEAIAEYRRAENARKSAKRNEKKAQGNTGSASGTDTAE
jgi:hypothetical protein